MLDLGIVIVNWNTRDLLRECLRTVFASEGVSIRVLVVDNASTDGSAEMVRAEFPQVELIVNADNVGYPAGNNVGLRALGYEGTGQVAMTRRVTRCCSIRTPKCRRDALRDMVALHGRAPEVMAWPGRSWCWRMAASTSVPAQLSHARGISCIISRG